MKTRCAGGGAEDRGRSGASGESLPASAGSSSSVRSGILVSVVREQAARATTASNGTTMNLVVVNGISRSTWAGCGLRTAVGANPARHGLAKQGLKVQGNLSGNVERHLGQLHQGNRVPANLEPGNDHHGAKQEGQQGCRNSQSAGVVD